MKIVIKDLIVREIVTRCLISMWNSRFASFSSFRLYSFILFLDSSSVLHAIIRCFVNNYGLYNCSTLYFNSRISELHYAYRIIMYQLEYAMSTKLTYVKISVRLRYMSAQSRICDDWIEFERNTKNED